MPVICQKALPLRPWAEPATARLPGLSPVAAGDWLIVDDAYGAQMAYREDLLATKRASVLRRAPGAAAAAAELLGNVLAEIAPKPGFACDGSGVTCPDGRTVTLERSDPLATCGRLVQEDLVILEKAEGAGEHVITGAVLCFPASWTLDEKFGRPLTRIHRPVPRYDSDIARRVQRLCDGIRPGAPIWRANALLYGDPELHQPLREDAPHLRPPDDAPRWLRMERQTLARLPESGAVVFSIHTYVLPFSALDRANQAAALAHATLV